MKELVEGLTPQAALLPFSDAKVITSLHFCKFLFKNFAN